MQTGGGAAPGGGAGRKAAARGGRAKESGGGKENSRKRIYAKYQQGKTPEEMAVFLQKEYGTTGKGFEFDGKQVSVWFDEQGMSIGHGTSALEYPVATMS